ncbi:response regulator [Piscibacillus sp. B03]|uniref:response regulator n=1 Tax=Piscibacillus sp. B03 TaxID=3457430 RepID=UPI003FCDA63D
MVTVMIADDSKFMRKWLKRFIQARGYQVIVEASDGQEAIDLYKQRHPTLVCLDITMPKVDGLTALREILDYDSHANIIMCSSMATHNNIEEANQIGAKGFIIKPYFEQLDLVLRKTITST